MRIDLHSHSHVSDGTDAPAEVVSRAARAGLDVLALTDHDTVAGIAEAARHLPEGLTLVPGMELSCGHEGTAVHVLCYLFDPAYEPLAAEARRVRDDRVVRARRMVERLRAAGAAVSWERVTEIAGDTDGGDVIGRPHLAQAVVEAGAARNTQDAFDRWLSPGRPAFVPRYTVDAVRAVELVREAGGVCVLAHPARGEGALAGAVPVTVVARMVRAGLFGIEAHHPSHDAAEREYWTERARELGVVVTGSSDDHGALTGHRLGCDTTRPAVYTRLLATAAGAEPITGRAGGRVG